MGTAATDRLPAVPLSIWVQHTLEKLAREYDGPSRVLAERLENSEGFPTFSFKAETVEGALARGEIQLWEVFHDAEVFAPRREGFCSNCDEVVGATAKGRCLWCDGPITPMTSKAERIVRLHEICIGCRGPKALRSLRCKPCSLKVERRPDKPGRTICPGCGGAKSREAMCCRGCFIESGGPRGRRQIKKPKQLKHLTPALLEEARDLYYSGRSMRDVVEQIFDRTTYPNRKNAESCLASAFRARGWPMRSKSEVQVLRWHRDKLAVAA